MSRARETKNMRIVATNDKFQKLEWKICIFWLRHWLMLFIVYLHRDKVTWCICDALQFSMVAAWERSQSGWCDNVLVSHTHCETLNLSGLNCFDVEIHSFHLFPLLFFEQPMVTDDQSRTWFFIFFEAEIGSVSLHLLMLEWKSHRMHKQFINNRKDWWINDHKLWFICIQHWVLETSQPKQVLQPSLFSAWTESVDNLWNYSFLLRSLVMAAQIKR